MSSNKNNSKLGFVPALPLTKPIFDAIIATGGAIAAKNVLENPEEAWQSLVNFGEGVAKGAGNLIRAASVAGRPLLSESEVFSMKPDNTAHSDNTAVKHKILDYNRVRPYVLKIEAEEDIEDDTPVATQSRASAGSPKPERNDSNNNRKPSRRERIGDWVGNKIAGRKPNKSANNSSSKEPKSSKGYLPFTGYKNGTWLGNIIRGVRDWQTVGTGTDLIHLGLGAAGEVLDTTRVSNANWNLEKYTPIGFLINYSTEPKPNATLSTNTDQNVNVTDTVTSDSTSLTEEEKIHNENIKKGTANFKGRQ